MYMKKTLAVILAVVLALSSLAVVSFAADVNYDQQAADATEAKSQVTFKVFRQVDGNWVDSEGYVKRGEDIQVRVYLESNYYVGDAQLLVCLSKDFFDFSSLTKADILFDNAFLSEVEYNKLSNTTRLAKDGYAYQMSQEEYDAYDYLYFQPYMLERVSASTVSGHYWGSMGGDDDYFFAFGGKIADDADPDCEGILGTITSVSNADMTRANAYGYNNFSYYDVASQKSYAAYNWLVDGQRPVYVEDSVKVVNDVVFLPGEDCTFDAADEDAYTITDYIGEEVDAAALAAIPDILDAANNTVPVSGWIECDSTGTPLTGAQVSSISAGYETRYFIPVTGQSVIKFDANGGTFVADSAESVSFSGDPGAAFTDTVPVAADLERDGYEFTGWADDTGVIVDDFTALTYADPVGTTTFTAQWKALTKTITYWVDGELLEDSQNPQTVACDSAFNTITPSAKLIPDGYRFIKWQVYDENTKEYKDVPSVMPSEDLELYALLEPESVLINYVIDGTYTGQRSTDVDSAIPVDVTGSIIGYQGPAYGSDYFKGWYTNEGCTNALASDAKVPAAGMTLYAKTEIPATFDANGGQFADGTDEAVTYTTYLGEIPVPEDPTLEGSEFSGWAPFTPQSMDVPNGKEFVATWTSIEYTYKFVIEGQSPFVNEGLVLGDDIDKPQTDIPGKVFQGWSLVKNDETSIVTVPEKVTAPAVSTTYYAIYTPAEYTVNYFIDGETAAAHTDNYVYGDTITVWEAAPVAGSSFDGWYLNDTLTGDKLTAITIGDDTEETINVYGKYAEGTFTVTFNANGGEFEADGSTIKEFDGIAYGAEINEKVDDPIKAGSEFKGWSRNQDADAADASFGTMDSEDGVTFYAVWETKSFPATFYANGGEYADQADKTKYVENVAFGDDIPVPAAPVREGYVFNGWKESADATSTLGTAAQPQLGAMDVENGKSFYADWSATACTVIYNGNDGKWTDGETYKTAGADFGSDIEAYATSPEKAGSEFLGWSRTKTATEADVSLGKVDAANVTVYAVYSAKLLTAAFDANGGQFADSAATSKDVAYGATINNEGISEPTRTGYAFKGWSRDKDIAAEDFDDNTPLGSMDGEDGVTFYAVWKANTHTITYKIDGVQDGEVETYSFGDPIVIREAPVKDGYTFNGWTPNTLAATMPDEDIEVVGSYTANTYSITYYIDGVQDGAAETLAFDATVIERSKPSQTGYTFAGWDWYKQTADGEVKLTSAPAKMPAADLVVKGTYTPVKNNVVYKDADGNSFATFNNVEFGTPKSQFTPARNPSKEGSTFKGWSPEIPDNMPETALSFTPVFEVNKHSVTYNLNEGTGATGATYSFTDVPYGTEKAQFTPSGNPTRNGFVFAGWDKVIPDTMPDEDLTFTAQWNPVSANEIVYTVSAFYEKTSGGYDTTPNFYTSDSDTEGAAIKLSDFDGAKCPDGFVTDDTQANVTEITLSSTDNALVIYYKRTTSEITWSTDEGTITGATSEDGKEKKSEGTFGTEITEPEVTRPGYDFTGWKYTNADTGEEIDKPSTVPSFPVNAEAQWEKAEYKVTYYIDDVQDGDAASVEYEAAINERSKPSKAGHDFNGWDWYAASAPETKIDKPATMPAYDLIAKGTYTKKNIPVSFSAGDGEFPKDATTSKNIPFGDDVTADGITEPTREGYDFAGWSLSPDGTNPGQLGKADGEKPVTVYAAWAAKQYNVTYDANGGEFSDGTTISDEGKFDYGTAVPACSKGEPTKEGASFDHWEWYQDMDTGSSSKAKARSLFSVIASAVDWQGISTPSTVPAGDLKALAVYTDDTEAVFYEDYVNDAATKVGGVKGAPGTPITAPNAPSREGYDFLGWYEVNDDGSIGTDKVTDFGTLPATGSKKYTAKWAPKTVSVLFDAMGGLIDGSGSKTVDYNYNADIAAPSNPTRDGHTFKGWSTDKTNVITDLGNAKDSNNKFFAVWEEIPGVKHTVSFYTTDETPEYSTEISLGAAIPGYTAQSAKPGKVFDSWKWYKVEDDGSKTEIARPTSMPDYDVAAVAQYVDAPVKQYDVIFDCNNGKFGNGTYSGQSYVSFKLTEGDTIKAPGEPVRDGYIFKGWKPGVGSPDVGSDMPAKNVSYQAQWEKLDSDKFTVTYEVDGTALETIQVDKGAAVPANTKSPIKDGYTFKGWEWTNASGDVISKPDTVTENLVAKAKFEKDAAPDDGSDKDEPLPEINIDDILIDPGFVGGLFDSLVSLIPDGKIDLPDWGKNDGDTDGTDDGTDDGDDSDIPDTGSATGIVVFAVISGAAAAAYVFTKKKDDDDSDED